MVILSPSMGFSRSLILKPTLCNPIRGKTQRPVGDVVGGRGSARSPGAWLLAFEGGVAPRSRPATPAPALTGRRQRSRLPRGCGHAYRGGTARPRGPHATSARGVCWPPTRAFTPGVAGHSPSHDESSRRRLRPAYSGLGVLPVTGIEPGNQPSGLDHGNDHAQVLATRDANLFPGSTPPPEADGGRSACSRG